MCGFRAIPLADPLGQANEVSSVESLRMGINLPGPT